MRTEDFFTLILKLFGLYSLVTTMFYFFPQLLGSLSYGLDGYELIIVYFIAFLLMILITILLIRKSRTVVKWLKISEGFQDKEINLNLLGEGGIIKIACIILGGILLFDCFPEFLGNTIELVSKQSYEYLEIQTHQSYWVISLVKLFLSLSLIFYYKQIQQLIAKF